MCTSFHVYLALGTLYQAQCIWYQVSCAQVHFNGTLRFNYCLQGEMVPEYNVTTTFKAFVGAISSQENYGINKPFLDRRGTVVLSVDGRDGISHPYGMDLRAGLGLITQKCLWVLNPGFNPT